MRRTTRCGDRGLQGLENQFGRHRDGGPQRPVDGASIREDAVRPLRRLKLFGGGLQMHAHVNPSNHQDPFLQLNFAGGLGNQSALGCVDFARLQRASEGSRQSAGRAGDDVIERGRSRRERIRRNLVVFGDGPVDAENYRVLFGRKERPPDWSFDAFDPDIRAVHNFIGHGGNYTTASACLFRNRA